MTGLRNDLPMDSEAAAARLWVRPAVQRLTAGSAEDGRGATADAQNPS